MTPLISVLGMRGGDEETQPRLILRHADLDDRRHIIAIGHQMPRRVQRLEAVGEKDRHDAAPDRRPGVEPGLARQTHK